MLLKKTKQAQPLNMSNVILKRRFEKDKSYYEQKSDASDKCFNKSVLTDLNEIEMLNIPFKNTQKLGKSRLILRDKFPTLPHNFKSSDKSFRSNSKTQNGSIMAQSLSEVDYDKIIQKNLKGP